MKKLSHSEILSLRLTPEKAKSYKRHPVSLMALNIRSLYNVGSLFRTSDSGLAGELILVGYTPHPPREEIKKTALGADESVQWKYFKTSEEAVEYQKSMGRKIFALEITDTARDYSALNISDYPMCIILGNELTGIDNQTLNLCDDSIQIPMYGVKHSLNVSVAAGIALYEAVRIWKSLSV